MHCIGRSAWRSLAVRDAREARTAEEVFDACLAPRPWPRSEGLSRLQPTGVFLIALVLSMAGLAIAMQEEVSPIKIALITGIVLRAVGLEVVSAD